jgi:hypothetical protein
MIVEYAQLLSTAHRIIDGYEVVTKSKTGRKKTIWVLPDYREHPLYDCTHANHPSAKWCRDNAENYQWLYSLFIALCDEYSYRYEKVHATDTLLRELLKNPPKGIKQGKFSPPWRAMPEQYKVDKSKENYCQLSYQGYFNGEKQSIAQWKGREEPYWYFPIDKV